MAGIGLLLSVGGMVMQAAGASQAAKAEAAVQEANARALEKKAMATRAIASVDAERRQQEARKVQSEQQARFAATGAGTDGTADSVIRETGMRGRHNSNLEVWQGGNTADGYLDQAAIARFAAKQKEKAAKIGVGTALLTGASKIFGSGSFSTGGGGTGGSLYYG